MSAPILATANILESSTVALSAGAAATGYPLSRLFDRNPARMFAGSAAATTTVKIDQGGGALLPVNSLLIPAGHNLAGVWLSIKHSSDDVTYTNAVTAGTWWSDASAIYKSWEALTKRYWQFTMTTPAAAPQFAELLLGSAYTCERSPSRPSGALETDFNVSVDQTPAGSERYIQHGPARRRRNYDFPSVSTAQASAMKTMTDTLAGAKPWFLCDHEGAWIWGNLSSALAPAEIAAGRYRLNLDFRESL